MQDIIDSDEFTHWFGVLVNLVNEYDLTDSEIAPDDFVEPFLNGDSQQLVVSLYFNFDLP
jgi:hypothetical protein